MDAFFKREHTILNAYFHNNPYHPNKGWFLIVRTIVIPLLDSSQVNSDGFRQFPVDLVGFRTQEVLGGSRWCTDYRYRDC